MFFTLVLPLAKDLVCFLNIWTCFLQCQEEQLMYPSSLENERFIVAVVNCGTQGGKTGEQERIEWEITRAIKV